MTERGLKFLMFQEGCKTKAYQDTAGVWTIGYGNTYWPDGTHVKKGDILHSNEEALELLKLIVPEFEKSVRNSLTSSVYDTLNDNQKDALTSLAYNIGGGNFQESTVCKRVKANKEDRTIKDAFNMWNKSAGQVLKGLVRRRAQEGALYFGEPVDIPNLPPITPSSTPSTRQPKTQVYDYSYGDNNMFYELSHSSDWVVTKFKMVPRKTNNWKSLLTNISRPKVGDLLFAYHDGKDSGVHDHVAIYLGVHEGNIYVAEGISVSGTNIFENNKKVQIARIQDSRLAYDTDIITHFAHCVKKEIKQSANSTTPGLASKTNNSNPVDGEENMKHFTLIDDTAHSQSSLLWSDTAHSKGIQNTPTQEARQNLVNLVNNLLDPLYEMVEQQGIGKIFVSSGYRNKEVNTTIGGASDSQHMSGQAVDIQVRQNSGTMGNALLKIAQLILKKGLSYDQMIMEDFETEADKGALRPVWIHLSFKSKEKNRGYSDTTKLMMWDKSSKKYIHLDREYVLSKPTA